MKRVHRNLSRDEAEALRERLSLLVPSETASISEFLRMMRLIARKSQGEYARMCGVAPRALANIEGRTGSPTVETLNKLLRPFGYRVGVVVEVGANAMDDSNAAPASRSPGNGSNSAARGALKRALKKG